MLTRTRRIYIFANPVLGGAFLETARRFRRIPGVRILIVYSGKTRVGNDSPGTAWRRWRARLAALRRDWRESRRLGLPVMTVERVNAEPFLSKVAGGSDGIVCGFNQIFRAPLISKFRTLINCHPSVLPFYRGPMPSHWCIRNGETRSGYTLHAVTERIDAGEILFQEAVAIDPSDDADALNERIMRRASITFEGYLQCLVRGEPFRRVLLDAHSVYRHHVDYASFPDDDRNPRRHERSGRA
jgi:hypothetical protein